MNKIAFRNVKLKDQGNDFEFWQTKSYDERLAVLEQLRRDYYGLTDETEPRLQKDVYKIFMRKPRKRKNQRRDGSINQ